MTIGSILTAEAKEPPFRRLVQPLVRVFPFSPRVKSLWDAADYPQYLFGVLHAAQQAMRERPRGYRGHRIRGRRGIWPASPSSVMPQP